MYENYKQLVESMAEYMRNEMVIDFLKIKKIDSEIPERQNVIKFGLILTEMQQFLATQQSIQKKIRQKLFGIIKHDKSFSKIINFIHILNNEYCLEFSQQLLDELSHFPDGIDDLQYSIQDILYEILKRIKTNFQNHHIKSLLQMDIKHSITYRLTQLNQASHITYMYQHNEKIVLILIQVCNQEAIPIPQIVSCLHLQGDQMKLRIDFNLEKAVVTISQVKKVAEELGYNNQSLAFQGLLELRLQYYKQFLDVSEQDLIDSALTTLVQKGTEVNQIYIRQLLNQLERFSDQPQLKRVNFLFNQILQTSMQMVEKRQQNKNYKININIVICEALERMTKEKCGFPQLISFLKVVNHQSLKLDAPEQNLHKYYQYLNRSFVDLYNVTSQTQLYNFCKTQLLNQSYQNEIDVFERMLNVIYQDKQKYFIELKQIFDQPETKSLIMILNITKDKFGKIHEIIQHLQAYAQQKEIISLDSDEEIKKIRKQ